MLLFVITHTRGILSYGDQVAFSCFPKVSVSVFWVTFLLIVLNLVTVYYNQVTTPIKRRCPPCLTGQKLMIACKP